MYLKSHGFARAGSNPVLDDFFWLLQIFWRWVVVVVLDEYYTNEVLSLW